MALHGSGGSAEQQPLIDRSPEKDRPSMQKSELDPRDSYTVAEPSVVVMVIVIMVQQLSVRLHGLARTMQSVHTTAHADRMDVATPQNRWRKDEAVAIPMRARTVGGGEKRSQYNFSVQHHISVASKQG